MDALMGKKQDQSVEGTAAGLAALGSGSGTVPQLPQQSALTNDKMTSPLMQGGFNALSSAGLQLLSNFVDWQP